MADRFPHKLSSDEKILLRMDRDFTESEAYSFVRQLQKDLAVTVGQQKSYIQELQFNLKKRGKAIDKQNRQISALKKEIAHLKKMLVQAQAKINQLEDSARLDLASRTYLDESDI